MKITKIIIGKANSPIIVDFKELVEGLEYDVQDEQLYPSYKYRLYLKQIAEGRYKAAANGWSGSFEGL